ncbi:hypothetical protein ABBQ38_010494 [Trebouxia sp. C0009 RCD-2024]
MSSLEFCHASTIPVVHSTVLPAQTRKQSALQMDFDKGDTRRWHTDRKTVHHKASRASFSEAASPLSSATASFTTHGSKAIRRAKPRELYASGALGVRLCSGIGSVKQTDGSQHPGSSKSGVLSPHGWRHYRPPVCLHVFA